MTYNNGTPAAAPQFPVGMNISGIGYFYPAMPFLNILKSCCNWITASASVGDTGEEGYMQVDWNGYPTSLTANPSPSGGQQFNHFATIANFNLPTAPADAPGKYQAGYWRLKFLGQGTASLSDDTTLTLTNSTPVSYISGTANVTNPGGNSGLGVSITAIPVTAQVAISGISGTTMTVTGVTGSAIGVGYPVNSVPGGPAIAQGTYVQAFGTGTGGAGTYILNNAQTAAAGTVCVSDHPRDFSLVWAGPTTPTSTSGYQQLYDTGGIFHPWYLAQLANMSCVRFMAASNTPQNMVGYDAPGTIAAGSTSFAMTANWPNATVTKNLYFCDGEVIQGTFTIGSPTVTLASALVNNINPANFPVGSSGNYFWIDWSDDWTQRGLPSYFSWAGPQFQAQGNTGDLPYCKWPIEVAIALCNALGADLYLNVPLAAATGTNSWYRNAAALIFNGTGIQAGFQPLGPSQNVFVEVGNENWNTAYPFVIGYRVAVSMGTGQWYPTQTLPNELRLNFYGQQCALVAQDFQTVLTTPQFARCYPLLGSQAANSYNATDALNSAYWTGAPKNSTYTTPGPAYNYPIKGVNIAPYWGYHLTGSDLTNITVTISNQAQQLNDLFALMTGNVSPTNGYTYSSVPSNGWQGQAEGYVTAHQTALAGYATHYRIVAYEAGQNLLDGLGSAAWNTLAQAAQLDARMGNAFHNYCTWWRLNVGGTRANPNNLFVDVDPLGGASGDWGIIQTIMEYANLANIPKWAAIQSFIANG